MDELILRDQKGIYSEAINGIRKNVVGVDINFDMPNSCNLKIENSVKNNLQEKVSKILKLVTD